MLRHHRSLFLTAPCTVAVAILLMAGCNRGATSGTVEDSYAALTTTTTFEAESLTRTSSAVGTNVSTGDCTNSNCAYVQFAGNAAVGDWIELALPNLTAGTQSFVLYFKANNNRGISRASVDGANLGSTCDEYAAAAKAQVACNLGSVVLAAGNHKMRFTVTGKNAASSGYAMTLDKIVLTTTSSGTGGAGGSSTGGSSGTGGVTSTGGTISTGGSTGTPIVYEAESLTRTSSTIGSNAVGDANASGGSYVQLNTGSGVNDWIAFTIPNLAAGPYGFAMFFKSNTNRGINQASLDGTNLGSTCDEYRAGASQYNLLCNFGASTVSAGSHTLRFSVAGKNAASSGHTMTIDKIVLTPLGGGTGGAGGMGTGGAGTGGVGTGGVGTGGTGGTTTTFPGQACFARADALVAQMTADEKYAQMLQMERGILSNAQVTQYGIGSALSSGGSAPTNNTPTGWADMTDGYRRAALNSRLKIPFLYGADEVHGASSVPGAVVFPHNIGLGATHDLALVEQVGRVTALESLGCGIEFTFSPVVAVTRDERWGRTYESFGETPELVGPMGAALIKGLQLTTTSAMSGMLASAKHYAGDGGTVGGANNGDTVGDNAVLKPLHVEPYRQAVNARVGSIMASYSSWNGTRMHINKEMITNVLKGQLGFGGFVISDYNGCFQSPLGLSDQAGIIACLDAGVDMYMVSTERSVPTMIGLLAGAVQGGIPMSRINDAVRRIIAVKCELGLFEKSGFADRALTAQVGSAEHRALARKAVQESLVVLKNNTNTLPLAKTSVVALAGANADNTGNQCGGWTLSWQGGSGNIVPGATSIRQAMQTAIGAGNVVYSLDGTSTAGATVGVAVIGETPYAEGQGDKTNLTVTAADVAVVQKLKQAGLKTVVVLIAGRPMILDPLLAYADAIVVAWLPGSEGAGVTDILFGDAHPMGQLPHSWPRSMAQLPINYGDASYDPLFAYQFGLTY